MTSIAQSFEVVRVGIALLVDRAVETSKTEGFPFLHLPQERVGSYFFSPFEAIPCDQWEALNEARPYLAPYWSMMLGYRNGSLAAMSRRQTSALPRRLREIAGLELEKAWDVLTQLPDELRPEFLFEINEGFETGDLVISMASNDREWMASAIKTFEDTGCTRRPS